MLAELQCVLEHLCCYIDSRTNNSEAPVCSSKEVTFHMSYGLHYLAVWSTHGFFRHGIRIHPDLMHIHPRIDIYTPFLIGYLRSYKIYKDQLYLYSYNLRF